MKNLKQLPLAGLSVGIAAVIGLITLWIPLMILICLVTGKITWRHLLWPFGL